MRTLTLLVSLVLFAPAQSIDDPDYVQFRLVAESYRVDVPLMKVRATGHKVQLEDEILFNLHAVERVEIRTQADRPGEFDVRVLFTPEDAARFRRLTDENVGRSLAVVVGGDVTLAPQIQEAVSQALLYYDIPEHEARATVDLINAFLRRQR